MKTKILVLGSNGFVGREVVKLLSKKNILLSCFSRSKKKNINLEKKKIKDLVINNDVIINCVGENFRKKYMYKNNFLFVKELIKIINSSKKKKKLIHLSSAAVYGKFFHKKNFIIDINTPTEPTSYYAQTKLKADNCIIQSQNKKLKFIIIRPSQVIGKNMQSKGFVNLINFIKLRLFFFIDDVGSIRNYVMIENLSAIIFTFCLKHELFNNKIYIVSRYSKLINIVRYIKKKLNIIFYPNIVLPQKIVLFFLNILIFLKINTVVKKEIIEHLSTSIKIKSNINKILNIKYKNINSYLNYLLQ